MAYFPTRWLTLAAFLLIGCAGPPAETVPVWGRFEHTFTTAAGPDTRIAVTFTGPDGTTRTVDAFWDGGTTWRVRFMPDVQGLWRFQADGPAAQTVSGTFEAMPAPDAANPFLRHGAVRVSDTGTHFVHADGTPFFWLGDTAWNGALLASEADWQAYLQHRRAQGFTGIQFVATPWRTAYTDAAGQVAYTTGADGLTINPAFFQRLDRYVDAVNEAGLLAAPVLLWALGDPAAMPVPGKLPEAQAITLARYLVARYGGHHVFWFLAGDENYSGERAERWRRIGRGVFGEGHPAPVTLHPQGMQWHVEALRSEPWLDVLVYQSGHGDDANTLRWIHSGPPAQHWASKPIRPLINAEPPYENHLAYQSRRPHTAYTVRRAIYWSLLNAPPAGVTYGGHGLWSWETRPAVPLNHERSGMAPPWHEALAYEGSQDMTHVAELMSTIDWWRLRPAQNLLADQPGRDDPARFVGAARTAARDLALLYLPVGGSVRLSEAAGTTAYWFDPRTGARHEVEGSRQTYTAPDDQDWLLVLR
ncbi:MAG: DUF4038 domain-containing protein [Bacteroidetes bacterium]|nr:MAG: DUF4038 domain-containing protein [Bacteroidota bacterium]